jgi:hypothetical protein
VETVANLWATTRHNKPSSVIIPVGRQGTCQHELMSDPLTQCCPAERLGA